jgi:endonuclease/exonuclease/phosphatase (EEP) superfamily protein YafD
VSRAVPIAGWTAAGLLLAVAVPITAARLVEPPVGLALQLEAFAPFALPLYAAALVLLAALLLRARRRGDRSRPALAAAGVATVGLALHAWWFAPLVTGDAPEAADRGGLAVLTANILEGRGDVAVLATEVRERDIDVLVVNEITPAALAALDAHGLADALPHRGGRPGEGTRGTMVFAARPVEVVERVATRLDSLVVRTGGLTVLAVHPVPPLDGGTWGDEHDALLAATREHRPDLIVGDFNATLDHAPLRHYADLGYRDAVELTDGGFAPTWPTRRGPGLIGLAGALGPTAQIDHVLVSERWTVTAVATRDLEGSDHRYVVAQVAPRH